MRLLTNDDVAQVLSMDGCIAALRTFFREDAAGRAASRPRTEVWLPRSEPGQFYQCKTMEGALAYRDRHVVRIDSNVSWERSLGGAARVEHRPLVGGGWMGILLVFDAATGELRAVMPDGYLQRMRVGALFALAADALARADARTVGLVGSGWQAGGQVLGLAAVRRLSAVRVYSPDPDHRRDFAAALSQEAGVAVEPVASAADAVAGADIVALATNAGQPVSRAEWAEPGQHVSSVRLREMDPAYYDRADLVVVNRTEPWIAHHVVGPLQPADVAQAALPPAPQGRSVEAAELFAGRAGRSRAEALTVFPNEASNFRLGAQFAAVASLVESEAAARGLGQDLPLDWFAQRLHP